jgi:hypothetical protein
MSVIYTPDPGGHPVVDPGVVVGVVVHAVTPGMLGPPAVQLGAGVSEVPVVPAGRLNA